MGLVTNLGMDIGCLDLGCIERPTETTTPDSHNSASDKVSSASKTRKNKSPKGTGQSPLNILNRFTSQIKKPSHRKSSPLNWFPRKKVDSYLNRKIKMLQEADGMNLTLDETLGDTNPHYSRVLREKMAAREAANWAMEARKAALVEASWCRILQAAGIQCRDEETRLLKAEKVATEAFEAASALGVIMYDISNSSRKHCQIKTSTDNGGKSTTHTVTATFETAFDVDKQVASAVKSAIIKLPNCDSFNKDEFKELLRKISQNPDAANKESPEISLELESEYGSDFQTSQSQDFSSQDTDCKLISLDKRKRKSKKRQSLEKLNITKLVDMMLERLRNLKEDELASMATTVATCGLNDMLAEVESNKLYDVDSVTDHSSTQAPNFSRRVSSVNEGTMRHLNLENFISGRIQRKQNDPELPSLEKSLVKHMSRLEREVQEAKNNKRNGSGEKNQANTDEISNSIFNLATKTGSADPIPGLESILVKHTSKFEKEIEEAKKSGKDFPMTVSDPKANFKELAKFDGVVSGKKDVPSVPSLDKFLVKHVSRLEKEVHEAKSRRKNDSIAQGRKSNVIKKLNSSMHSERIIDKSDQVEQINVKTEETISPHVAKDEISDTENSLDKILVKPLHRMEREKNCTLLSESNYAYPRYQNKQKGNKYDAECEGLDKILVKHVSRLEKEKKGLSLKKEDLKVNESRTKMHEQINEEGGLDQILVKHKSRLEREKLAAAQRPEEQPDEQIRLSQSRREARERELQEAWGGLSLGNSIRPHLSKLERDKAAWIKAEEEERRRATAEV
ncbi:hypothetical protein K2173_002451 [Erythroxylum novogranatense]|uniref:Uncharacterized protein n=1 Tax=Erythroxylum novogranatense TaxID=1862640 RepID=A0AAV8TBK7_9ROSI|nr:hypothetical protein K2173_002451 [Erythroxylum novogranatense]